MPVKSDFLSMIGHGTQGTDGIDEGIHLRWSFQDKLGFPPCFKLYRRLSNAINLYHMPVEDMKIGNAPLPYTVTVAGAVNLRYVLESLVRQNMDTGIITVATIALPDGSAPRCLHIIDGKLTIRFSKPVSRITLHLYLGSGSRCSVSTLKDENESVAYNIEGGKEILGTLDFDAPGSTGLIISGSGIRIITLETWIVGPQGGDWKRINDQCGCGLPVNQTGTPYTEEYYHGLMIDLATTLCRLGHLTLANSPITLAEFLELKGMLLTMTDEGISVPVGWNLFPGGDEVEGETTQSVDFSKYDFLLTQSLQVFFAKILGLYFVDKDVLNNQYYDYKITAEWPVQNKRRLDHVLLFDDYDIGQVLPPIHQLNPHVVLLAPGTIHVVTEMSDTWRTATGIAVTPTLIPVVISFLKPVTEVQLIIYYATAASGPPVEIEAYQNGFTSYVDKAVVSVERGMIRLRSEQIDYVRIKGRTVVVSAIHYDFEAYPVGLQEYMIPGLIKHKHIPIQTPTDVAVTMIPGGTISHEDGTVTEKPYMAGVRWRANENTKRDMISIAPILYHVERKPQDGAVERMTEDAPLFVAPSEGTLAHSIPAGWPAERQYITDQLSSNAITHYRVAAMDLFGRMSSFTPFETYSLIPPKSPHPLNVTAKFLDYTSYNTEEGVFSDTMLNSDERSWLITNASNGIVVRWEWPLNLQQQAPEVDSFRVFIKPGWLNTYTGTLSEPIETLINKSDLNLTTQEEAQFPIFAASAERLEAYRFHIVLDTERTPPKPQLVSGRSATERPGIPRDFFRLCWLVQGSQSFLVVKNTDDPQPVVWALKLYGQPSPALGFSIACPPNKAFFIDYRESSNWPVELHQETRDARTSYEVYIANPFFPDPPIMANDVRKVRYAQIGISACIDSTVGSVSSAATILAVYRHAPAVPQAFVSDNDVDFLRATPCDVYGKSSFALRWNKGTAPVKFHVYRTLDETLFSHDYHMRADRDAALYDVFIANHPYFNEFDINAVVNIPHGPSFKDVRQHYRNLTPLQLQILASLPDNNKAFTRINDLAIDPSDTLYADRVTEIPDPVTGTTYSPANDKLLYVDNTLNGQSTNYFFYAVKSVDTNGLSSQLSLSTLPVLVPNTTPPPAPVITSVTGGESQVILSWAKNPAVTIAGYLVYRTPIITDAGDWRKMELIKDDVHNQFSVTVGETLPLQFQFFDTTVIAGQPYYYGIVAVALNDDKKWLRSRMSNIVYGQGYELIPPEPPVWDEENSGWVYVDDKGVVYEWDADLSKSLSLIPAVRLCWHYAEASLTQISKSTSDSPIHFIIKEFAKAASQLQDKQFVVDKEVSPGNTYQYGAKAKSHAGIMSTVESKYVIYPKPIMV